MARIRLPSDQLLVWQNMLAQGAGIVVDLRREATGHLTRTLGDERLRELRAQGEVMGTDEIVRRTLILIDPLD